jgi:hypothetical protein
MRRHVTRLAERLVEAHHVDAAELHLMTDEHHRRQLSEPR